MLKKFFVGALATFMLMTFGASIEATQIEQKNICCCGDDGRYQNCDEPSGEYCDRYGCRKN